MSQSAKPKNFWQTLLRLGLWPALFYFFFFALYTWPLLTHFRTVFFCDNGDGFQNVWNIWWVNKAVTVLHTSPWWTNYLHYPYGVSLLVQTLNPINGFLAIPLLHFLPLIEVHNLIVVFAFVFGGMSAMWLAYTFSKNYWSSLLGSFLFTFSGYHFAHGYGHLQLVSLEFMPLFLLLWWQYLRKPSYGLAIAAAVAAMFVVFSDHYYFIYSVVVALMMVGYQLWVTKELDLKNRRLWWSLAVFVILVMLTAGRLFLALLSLNKHDPLLGGHDSIMFGMDLLEPFIYTNFWHWGELTKWFWGGNVLGGNTIEHSVYLGVAAIVTIFYALFQWRKIPQPARFWLVVFFVFSIFAMGSRLKIDGLIFWHVYMPYALLNHFIPSFRISGMPVRMMVMSMLAAGVIVALVLPLIWQQRRWGPYVVGLLAIIMFIDLFPAPYVQTPPIIPGFVHELQTLPPGAVIDWSSGPGQALYYQTIYDRPMAFGYISRTPTSIDQKDKDLTIKISQMNFASVCNDDHLRYLVMPPAKVLPASFPTVYHDQTESLYDLKAITGGSGC